MSIYDGVNKVNDSLDKVSGLVSSKSEFIIKQAVNSVLLFIILIIFGCLDFATLTFHGEYLLTPSFWGTIGTKMIAALCAFNIGINMMLDNEIKKNTELRNNIETYEKLIALKDTDFEYFVIHIFNRKLKIQIYKSQINKQIYRLNKFSKAKDRLLYSSELEENKEKKLKNRYCRRRRSLEELKSDEFIEKNIDSLKVNFREIDPAAFELEINGAQKVKGIKVTGNVNYGRLKESSTIIMSMLLFSMLTTSFGLTASKEVFESQMVAFWHYCLKAVEDIGVVLWQYINGTIRTRKIVSSQLTIPYAGRNKVLKEYTNWHFTNSKYKSPSYEKLHQKEEFVEVELTQEQLNNVLSQNKEKDPQQRGSFFCYIIYFQ